ncbi:MAG TPA: B12-binding domain-containing radical SAM protein [Acidaminococcaceae bacterium]|nr:B12-binding domain-containing radical SAM protein [Acidaminococcaceae bacterium]
MQAFFIGTNSKYIHTALGIRYVTEYCRDREIAVHRLEAAVNEPLLSVLTRITEMIDACNIAEHEVIVLGLEVHIWNRQFVLELGELLRKVLPECFLMLGGPEVMFQPAKIFDTAQFADFIVCGEGEEAVAEFLQNLTRIEREKTAGNDVESVARNNISRWQNLVPSGIACRDENGKIFVPDRQLVIENLDKLPFPYPDIDEVVDQHKIVYYEASRGCPFHCAYCLSGISHSVRRRSLPLVLADMDRFMQAGATLVKFVDRTYNLDENYYLPMMRYLAQADTKTTFHFEIKADILSPRAVEFLRTVPKGRFQLEIGVQSTDADVLRIIGRKDDWDRLKDNVSALLENDNIHIHMDLIAGLPLETMESFARSFDDVYGLHPHALQLGFLKVLSGTVMEKISGQHGLVYMDRPPYEVLSTNYMNYNEMRFLKILEEVFELTANSGRFPFTLAFLTEKAGNGSAFVLYRELTEWYRQKGMAGLGHNVMETAEMLFKYVEERQTALQFPVRELLRLDVLQHLPNFRPDWLKWRTAMNYEKATVFWRNEKLVRKYVPDYSFKNWRTLHKKYALEEFLYNPWTGEKKSVFVLVNYGEMCLTRIESDAIM